MNFKIAAPGTAKLLQNIINGQFSGQINFLRSLWPMALKWQGPSWLVAGPALPREIQCYQRWLLQVNMFGNLKNSCYAISLWGCRKKFGCWFFYFVVVPQLSGSGFVLITRQVKNNLWGFQSQSSLYFFNEFIKLALEIFLQLEYRLRYC